MYTNIVYTHTHLGKSQLILTNLQTTLMSLAIHYLLIERNVADTLLVSEWHALGYTKPTFFMAFTVSVAVNVLTQG